MELSDIYSEC